MRTLASLLITALVVLPVLNAAAQDRPNSRKSYDRNRYERQHRTSTMDREGRCIRDNGRPMNTLDLDNRCDREEFWERFRDQGGQRN